MFSRQANSIKLLISHSIGFGPVLATNASSTLAWPWALAQFHAACPLAHQSIALAVGGQFSVFPQHGATAPQINKEDHLPLTTEMLTAAYCKIAAILVQQQNVARMMIVYLP